MQLLTTTAAAQRLGVVPQTIRRCVRRGELKPFITPPSGWLFKDSDVDKLGRLRAKQAETA